ncbi:MAG TPA: hypothetical protein DEU95_00215 [Chloroflexi bacterium]|nr:hypothetical protein [Chloroflexota bacterium]
MAPVGIGTLVGGRVATGRGTLVTTAGRAVEVGAGLGCAVGAGDDPPHEAKVIARQIATSAAVDGARKRQDIALLHRF